MPFDPTHLTVSASINRVRIVDLPGIALPNTIKGSTAYDLLSSAALLALIRPHLPALGLSEMTPPSELFPALEECLLEKDENVRQIANRIISEYGERLAYLLLTLRRGDAVNRAARPEWDDSVWEHWASIRHIRLAGGLAGQFLGYFFVHAAQATLEALGVNDMVLKQADFAARAALIGAARNAPPDTQVALLFDFGGTLVKRAFASYHEGELCYVNHRPSLTSNCSGDDTSSAIAEQRAEFMLSVMQRMFRYLPEWAIERVAVMCSVASYITDGQPAPRGCYGVLGLLTDNVEAYFAERLQEAFGLPLHFRLLHDGSAAAASMETDPALAPTTAVISLGTALGIGFPPTAALRPIHHGFRCTPYGEFSARW